MTRSLLAALSLFFMAALPVQADIYKCVAKDGHITYSNMNDKGCKRLSLDPVPASSPATPAAKPAARTPTPADFPKVDEGAQRSRDSDRRRILDGELASEQKALDVARKELADQESTRYGDERNYQKMLDRLQPFKDRVALHERNVEALRSELSRLR